MFLNHLIVLLRWRRSDSHPLLRNMLIFIFGDTYRATILINLRHLHEKSHLDHTVLFCRAAIPINFYSESESKSRPKTVRNMYSESASASKKIFSIHVDLKSTKIPLLQLINLVQVGIRIGIDIAIIFVCWNRNLTHK